MVFIKHNSLKSDIYFNPIFVPCFSGSRFFRVQVFQGPGFSGFRFFVGPGFSGSGSRFFRVRIQDPGPGFRSSLHEKIFLKNSKPQQKHVFRLVHNHVQHEREILPPREKS